jgi:hypothetical protein
MSKLSKKLESLIKTSPEILPVKTQDGILVGSVLISSNGSCKNLIQNEIIVYKNINLNSATIKIANLLAKNQNLSLADNIYRADQEYGKWFADSQLLRNQHERARKIKDFDRADMFWARYIESRNKTTKAKEFVESLIKI